MPTTVNAQPYAWPWNGELHAGNTALLVIDMQTDFCGVGGYVDSMGYDISLTRAPIAPLRVLMARMRALGYPVMHTREGHLPDLSDCPPEKMARSVRAGAAIGKERERAGLVRNAIRLELLLGAADPGDLGAGVDDPGDGVEVDMAMLAGDALGHRHALFLGLVRQHRAAHHVAHRPDVGQVGAAVVVDDDGAALRLFANGSGDIPLKVTAKERIAYLMLWPHARPFHFAHPQPTLRSVARADDVAGLLAAALAGAAPQPIPAEAVHGRAASNGHAVAA